MNFMHVSSVMLFSYLYAKNIEITLKFAFIYFFTQINQKNCFFAKLQSQKV